MKTKNQSLRRAILGEIDRQGWGQSELAEHAGVHRGKLNMWINGNGTLGEPTLDRLIRSLGLVLKRARKKS